MPKPTTYEQQRKELERMLKNPEKTLKNVQTLMSGNGESAKPIGDDDALAKHSISSIATYTTGSTAAAGSGEFHILKHQRRAAYAEQEKEKQEEKRQAESEEFERKKRELERQDEAKTAKNRKRRRHKATSSGARHTGENTSMGPAPAPAPLTELLTDKHQASVSNGEPDDSDFHKEHTELPPINQKEKTVDVQAGEHSVSKPSLTIIDEDEF